MFCKRLTPSGVFWVYLALNLSTSLKALKALMSTASGLALTVQATPSEQGGVVREPEYLL
jgi:hypothetical protein